jgi:hypothetical protein
VAAADIVSGSGNNYGHAIAVDDSSSGWPNVYATGGFRGAANFNPTGTLDLTVAGGSSSPDQDVYVSQLTQLSAGAAAPSPFMGAGPVLQPISRPIGPAPFTDLSDLPNDPHVIAGAIVEAARDLLVGPLQPLASFPVGAESGDAIPARLLIQQQWLDGVFAQ